ncbi:GNAT family N-acetyltransferase [Algoriphagus marincola]|uniref:GNAT family N-acetyltransferase n=1 Tax=Algoriphagus marincola TaxID=264027 RepID=UPI0004193DB8|nr:GNAT family N-acetyltransferase [Algoriphagus marincola]
MSTYKIHEVQASDLKMLHRFARACFVDTYASQNTTENMDLYLRDEFSEERILQLLTESEIKFFFVKLENKVVGYIQLNWGKAQSETLDSSLEIARIYVDKGFQGRGIGVLLLKQAYDLGKVLGLDWLWLGVWEKNTKAINFYQKNRFQIFDQHVFKLGNDEQLDWMMRRPLIGT